MVIAHMDGRARLGVKERIYTNQVSMNYLPIACALALVVDMLFASEVKAGDAIPACGASGADPVVMILENAKRDEMAPYIASIASQLYDLPVCFRIEWRNDPMSPAEAEQEIASKTAREFKAIIIFWLVNTAKGYQFRLFLPYRSSENQIFRDVEISGEQGLAETLAVVARASIVTAITDKKSSSRTENPPSSAALPADDETVAGNRDSGNSPLPENNLGRLRFFAAYNIGITSVKTMPTHGAGLGLGVLTTDFLELFARYLALTPIEFSSGGVDASLQRHPIWMGGTFFYLSGRLEIGVSVALGIDYLTERFSVADENTELQLVPGSRVQVSIVPAANLSLRVYKIVYFTTSLCGEIVLNQFRYAALVEDTKSTLYDPWTIQPSIMIGIELRFL